MYVILVNQDNTLTTTQAQNIMQRSKLVDELWFLVQPAYNDLQTIECTALLEYVLPISRKYASETLVMSPEDYKGYVKFTLPVDTNLTAEFGEIELTLTFLYVGFDSSNNVVQRVRKTAPATIEVHPSKSWADVIPDSALSAIDQRILKTDAQIKALQDMSTMFNITKADNLKFNEDTAELQLLAGDIEIGDKVVLQTIQIDGEMLDKVVEEAVDEAIGDTLKDGIPAVPFDASGSGSVTPPSDPSTPPSGGDTGDNDDGKDENDNVVEF